MRNKLNHTALENPTTIANRLTTQYNWLVKKVFDNLIGLTRIRITNSPIIKSRTLTT